MFSGSGNGIGPGLTTFLVLQEELTQRYFDTKLLPILRQADASFVYKVTHEPDAVVGSKSIGEVGSWADDQNPDNCVVRHSQPRHAIVQFTCCLGRLSHTQALDLRAIVIGATAVVVTPHMKVYSCGSCCWERSPRSSHMCRIM